jgi:lipoate-protein ligase B
MHIIDLGLIEYRKALQLQKDIHAQVCEGILPAAIIVCRHYPVITIGRSAKAESLLLPRAEYGRRGIQVVDVDRGGDVTYHSPGQLVVYPIFPMAAFCNDLHQFLSFLEYSIIDSLISAGICASRRNGSTGVWVGERKIASIGIGVKRWVSYHGISIIVKAEGLEDFSLIKPCGMDISMTSVESELKCDVSFDRITSTLIRSLTYDQCIAACVG